MNVPVPVLVRLCGDAAGPASGGGPYRIWQALRPLVIASHGVMLWAKASTRRITTFRNTMVLKRHAPFPLTLMAVGRLRALVRNDHFRF